jgi:hypothetical protein
MISTVSRDFPFSRNQPLKSAHDWYIRILKNKLIKFKKQEDRTLWLSHGTCCYIRMYINVVAGSFMLCLQRDFYNIDCKIKHKFISGSAPPPSPKRKNSGVHLDNSASQGSRNPLPPCSRVFILPATAFAKAPSVSPPVLVVPRLLILCQNSSHILHICSRFALNKFRTHSDVFYVPQSTKKRERYPVKICIAFQSNLQAIVRRLLGS